MPPRSLACTRIRKRKRDCSPARCDEVSTPPASRPLAVVEIEGSDVEEELDIEGSDVDEEHDTPAVRSRAVGEIEGSDAEDDLDMTTEGSDVAQEPDLTSEEDDEPFAPDHYKPGLHYFVSTTLSHPEYTQTFHVAQSPLY